MCVRRLCKHELLPEIHVFLIADGWKQEDGRRILSDSMLESIVELFGPSLDVERLREYMYVPSTRDNYHGRIARRYRCT